MGNENAKEIDVTLPDGKVHEKCENGGVNGISVTITANGYTVDVPTKLPIEKNEEPPSPEVKTESTEYVILESQKSGPTEATEAPEAEAPVQTPDPSGLSEEDPPREQRGSLFSKMFKKKTAATTEKDKQEQTEDQTDKKPDNDPQLPNGKIDVKQENDIMNGITANGIQVLPEAVTEQSLQTESTEYVVLESQKSGPTEAEAPVQTPEEASPKEKRVSLFSKMFKKKTPATTDKDKEPEKKTEETNEDQADGRPTATDQTLESAHLQTESQPQKEEDEGESGPEPAEEEEREENIPVDSSEEENPVMNFFKSLVTPTKTSKKEAPASAASKDQPQPPETQPAPATTTTTVAQVSDPPAAPKGMPAPPPPPPEPPRAEPAAKATKPEEPKAAAKDSPKGKSAKDTLSRFFRSKTKHKDAHPSEEDAQTGPAQEIPEEAPQSVTEDQTDRHVDTQQSAEEPQTVVTEDKEQKPDASKASTLEAAAKPAPAPAAAPEQKKPEAKKSLLSFFKPKAAEPKAAPAAASAPAEPGPAKEDVPKAVKSTEATAEAKPATATPSGGEEAASPPKKQEKRNSITLFFKTLSQKRGSTDAAAQTEAVPAPSAEKTK